MKKCRLPRGILAAVLPLLAVGVARADFLDGRCVNAQSQGVAAVNIDALDGGGNSVSLSNDSTDANGFFHVTIPAGTFTIIFKPPAPPASTSMWTEIGPINVSGTTNVGTIQLNQGVDLSGRILNPSSAGVPNVDIDIVDAATGTMFELLNDRTDASGNFRLAAPFGPIELRFDPAPSGQTLAPLAMPLNLSGATNLGNLQLAQGFVVGAIVRRTNNNPVADVDVDTEVAATGADLYTPGDNTNGSGVVDFVVPAGTYTFEFCAPLSEGLATRVIGPTAINSNTSLGVVIMQNGFLMSGHVQSQAGASVSGATVSLRDGSGAIVPTCHDHTDASGNYATVVPPGTFTVCFLPPNDSPLGASCTSNVTVSGPTTVNGTLPAAIVQFCAGDGSLATACPCSNFGGAGRGCANSNAGSTGALLVASGSTYPDTVLLSASGMRPTALCIFLQGNALVSAGVLFGDGVRCTGGTLKRLGSKIAVAGASSYPQAGDLPIRQRSTQLGDVIPTGATRYYQTYYRDAAAFCPDPPGGTINITNGTRLVW